MDTTQTVQFYARSENGDRFVLLGEGNVVGEIFHLDDVELLPIMRAQMRLLNKKLSTLFVAGPTDS